MTTIELTEERPRRDSAPMWAALLATFFGAGRLRPGPGTWGSAAAILIWSLAGHWTGAQYQWIVLLGLTVLVIALGIPAATEFCRASGQKDPQSVVIDEVSGQWITLLFVPISWKTLLAGFILFRAFDILKPPPVRQLERLPEGIGIVMDDLAAGLYALLVMQLALHFRLLSA